MPKKKTRRPSGRRPAGSSRGGSTGEAARRTQPALSPFDELRQAQQAATRTTPGDTRDEPSLGRTPSRSPQAPVDASVLSVTEVTWDAVKDREPQALGMTYRFDAPEEGPVRAVTVRFRGERVGLVGRPGPGDTFDIEHRLPRVQPRSGRIALTARVLDVQPGAWRVRADARPERPALGGTQDAPGSGMALPAAVASGASGFAPVVRVKAPGVLLGAWPGFVSLGVVVGLIVQAFLVSRLHLAVGTTLLITLVACLLGVFGGKVYFLVLHRDRQLQGLWMVGMAIQGFVLTTIATAVAGALAFHIPVGPLLDATAPGLLIGMTLGRFGCFFGGCCAGRPTGSRWGVWSSDRELGVRRVPTQLLESAMAFAIALSGLLLVLAGPPSPSGVVFVGSIAAYTLGRQLLFPLRDLPRSTSRGRVVVLLVCLLALVADIAAAVFVR